MSVTTRNRNLLLACALLLVSPALFASNPSARTFTRMVYDANRTHLILFGGATVVDSATATSFDLDDTWEWVVDHWVERYPAHVPPGRSAFAMVYDSARQRTLIFGGRHYKEQLADTWSFDGNDWTQLQTAASPSTRSFTSAAYDPVRDRVVLFGGLQTSSDGKTTTKLYDTWEFDGTNWKQIASTGPEVYKPALVYDAARNQTLLLAYDTTDKTHMYAYDAAAGKWNELTPSTMPTCVGDAGVAYQASTQTVILFGGSCTTSSLVTSETWTWDGSNWTKSDSALESLSAMAIAYDERVQGTYIYGGDYGYRAVSTMYLFKDGKWTSPPAGPTPLPRSLPAFVSDPTYQDIWIYGGLDENGWRNDFWRYHSGFWEQKDVYNEGGPLSCTGPVAAWDTDRGKLVMVCEDGPTYEYDATKWTKMSPSKTPPIRRYSSMVYDPVQKKTVLFGGYSDMDGYNDQTWLWDGTNWTQQKKNPAPGRSLASMWYDPVMKKVVMYGGIGRRSWFDRLERFSDMWSFDPSNGWSEIKNVKTPGMRYGAQTAVDPRDSSVLLFGGIRVDVNGAVQSQVYSDDTWKWNGQSWAKLSPASVPPGRENGVLAYDPSASTMTLFGGYDGRWYGDLWTFDGNAWKVTAEDVQLPQPPAQVPPRRRVIR